MISPIKVFPHHKRPYRSIRSLFDTCRLYIKFMKMANGFFLLPEPGTSLRTARNGDSERNLFCTGFLSWYISADSSSRMNRIRCTRLLYKSPWNGSLLSRRKSFPCRSVLSPDQKIHPRLIRCRKAPEYICSPPDRPDSWKDFPQKCDQSTFSDR